MKHRSSKHIRPSVNGQSATFSEPQIKPVEVAIFLCLTNKEGWTLVERVPYNQNTQGSKLYIALRRRGFEVCYRAENGVKNVWARWPHEIPELALDEFGGDLDKGTFGAITEKELRALLEAEEKAASEAADKALIAAVETKESVSV